MPASSRRARSRRDLAPSSSRGRDRGAISRGRARAGRDRRAISRRARSRRDARDRASISPRSRVDLALRELDGADRAVELAPGEIDARDRAGEKPSPPISLFLLPSDSSSYHSKNPCLGCYQYPSLSSFDFRLLVPLLSDVEPLAVKHLDRGGVADDGVGGDGEVDEIDLESDYDEVVLEEEEDVENDEEEDVENVEDVKVSAIVEESDVEVGAGIEEQNVEGDDYDD
ncbi:hypothetical protein CMV_003256 [Castanea mollissima]|uniref:Uncharacterized protein n=1 Tax=Castanea mollissima TaxID=60419 RepID=A0A8J4RP45_9ROSI|nr:hypothetical protein CMV_003256 [Castanea mollissima]